jgi:hypothetical protein
MRKPSSSVRPVIASTVRAKRAPKVISLTPGQKAAATKRANGLDLAAVAAKALATRQANIKAAVRAARKVANRPAKTARKAA